MTLSNGVKRIIIISGVIITISIMSIYYITFVERNMLIVKNEDIVLQENNENELKVIQFSDTQLGEFYSLENLKKVVDKINKENADIVVFTGDLIDNAAKYNDKDKIANILKQINSKQGKYAIYGNHDYGGSAFAYYESIMSEGGFKVLKNESINIDINNKKVSIYGADDGLLGKNNIEKTMKNIKEENLNILLLHEPDLIDKYDEYPIDLALAGHSHGGQVYIPFYGPIKKNELSKKYYKGKYKIENGIELYVNTGLGNTKVPFRFLNVPEITVFNIKF